MINPRLLKGGAVAAACAVVGAAAGIAGSAAAPAHKAQSPSRARPFRLFGGPPVHSELVVPNQSNGFDTITMDRGAFQSLSGSQLTITEGTKAATYKMVTLTIPANSTVRRNDASASLTDIKSGDQVDVVQSPSGTVVNAEDATHQNQHGFGGDHGPGFFGRGRPGMFGHGNGPPAGATGPAGPPPGAAYQ